MNTTQARSASQTRTPVYPGVSFVTLDKSQACGQSKSQIEYFDVQEQTYSRGIMSGTRMAYELLKFCAEDSDYCLLFDVIAAANPHVEQNPNQAFSRLGAALGMRWAIETLLEKAFEKIDIDTLFKEIVSLRESEVAMSIEDDTAALKSMKRENIEFFNKMKDPMNDPANKVL